MGVLIPLVPPSVHVERTTVPYLTVERVPDAAVQLRCAVDLDIGLAPGEQLALPLTRDQAEELLQALAAHLGTRVIRLHR
ncbi:hypothetical protein GCM10010495_35260 [Kitasatospora herbaricolor]|uniref:hypothetical protein n=1 Tax=Kitasatospora herbaricolor TaxID=68217 RepID=UPI0017487061|nr:hypothetical protein [Kitasatospora herbaricolor]MDQ0310070.1 hypothetical protein [Kitasatospora herbaricolor]GGV17673.1 hypothetical protein GCM10010495_35260 [Kitasatospora herbaricolor]